MGTINLQFINYADSAAALQLLLFRKTWLAQVGEQFIVRQVIRPLGVNSPHPLAYGNDIEIQAYDAGHHYTSRFATQEGEQFSMQQDQFGQVWFAPSGRAADPLTIEVLNRMPLDPIDVAFYENKLLAATFTSVSPGMRVLFRAEPTLRVGLMPDVEPGTIIDPSTVISFTTLSLQGIASADITITENSPPPNPHYSFTIGNVVKR